jgi:hypothetical protein
MATPKCLEVWTPRLFALRLLKALGARVRAIEPANQDEDRGEPPWHNRREKNHSRAPSDTSLLTGR